MKTFKVLREEMNIDNFLVIPLPNNDSDEFYDDNGNLLLKIKSNGRIVNSKGNLIGKINDNSVYDSSGNLVGQWKK